MRAAQEEDVAARSSHCCSTRRDETMHMWCHDFCQNRVSWTLNHPYIVGVKAHMVITPNLYTDSDFECLLPPQVCSKINVPSNKGYPRHPNRIIFNEVLILEKKVCDGRNWSGGTQPRPKQQNLGHCPFFIKKMNERGSNWYYSPHVRVRVHACEPFIENLVVKKQQQLEYRSFLRGFSLKEKNEPSDQPANDRKKLTGSSYCRD